MPENTELLLCYNKGCGNRYDPRDNNDDACTFHPGHPVFHDSYKSWPCCNKRSTDFTEFLNIKGCTKARHSNVKPPPPEKPALDNSKNEIIEYQAPTPKVPTMERPPFETALQKITPIIATPLKSQIETIVKECSEIKSTFDTVVVGTSCKNGGCRAVYEGPESNDSICTYHPGTPVFHEGLKYWSCCKKKTTDFAVFMEQPGCENGTHLWVKQNDVSQHTNCRYDWHQTATHVVVSVFGKKYDPEKSSVELNPVRAKISLLFPETKSSFDKDMELYGIIDVNKCEVAMLQTKVEIKLKKAEPGTWARLEINRTVPLQQKEKKEKPVNIPVESDGSSEDLSDII